MVVYVDLPGHETGAGEIKEGKFPTMQQVGDLNLFINSESIFNQIN